jgi:hypothetical protein
MSIILSFTPLCFPFAQHPAGLLKSLVHHYSILARTGFLFINFKEMASSKKESRYESLKGVEDLDLENDSDTTLASEGFLGKNSPKRLSRHSRNSKIQTALIWSRWGFIVTLQSIILLLLLRSSTVEKDWNQVDTETGGDINGLYVPRESTLIEIFANAN